MRSIIFRPVTDVLFGLVISGFTATAIYGQEQPPAAEDELEWETRYFGRHREPTSLPPSAAGCGPAFWHSSRVRGW